VQANTHISRAVTIGAHPIIGQDNSIGRSVDIGARVETGNSVALGYADTIGNDVFLGAGTVAGALVDIGNNTTVEAGTVLARGVTILDSSSSASIGGIIGPDVQIGADAAIATTARIRKRATLGDNVTVLGSVRIGRDAQVGDGAIIGANVRISAGGQVTANSDVADGTVIARGEVFDNPDVGILDTGGVKAWEDGTYASSCYTYRYPVDGHVYEGNSGNGVYNIDPDGNGTPIQAQCEMLRQGGGWTMGVKTWYTMGIYGNASAVGSVSDALTTH
jgi:acyl-[acyl carrier protein]--UDP-N-acetylglucosamine O-acyltransferase